MSQTTFSDLGLRSSILKGLDELGFVNPSPIQEQAIPFILSSKQDLIALAQTGTGKTAAFSLPVLNQMVADGTTLQAIVLCPTRELCLQTANGIKSFSKHMEGLNVTAVYGGERLDAQIRAVKRGTNIVVGTPGRVHDLIRRRVLKLHTIQWVVLDEADEMLDMGFKDDLDAILGETPDTRQTLLFSATMSKSVHAIAKQYMHDMHEISVAQKNIGAEKVSHEYYVVQSRDRFHALKRILDHTPGIYGILFCRTRNETQDVAARLQQANYDTEALHGDVSQNMRTKIMQQFREKKFQLLVATDVAARGIDVNDLSHVINYNLPDGNAAYTHRSGRTGRAQKSGVSVAIVTPREVRRIHQLEKIIKKPFEHKQVPNTHDICQKQAAHLLETIQSGDESIEGNAKYFGDMINALAQLDKEALVSYVVSQQLGHLIDDKKHAYDLNASFNKGKAKRDYSSGGRQVKLKINIGKRQGFTVKGLFALMNSKKQLRGLDIGRIDLGRDDSVFGIPEEHAELVVSLLQGKDFQGKKVSIFRDSGGGERRRYGGGRRRGGPSGGRKRYSGHRRKGRR